MEKKNELVAVQNPWINTPFVYIRDVIAKKKDLTPLEQDILFGVSGSIQRFLKPFYDQGRHKDNKEPNSLFTDAELQRLDPIVVRMADYGINSAHYADIRKAVDSILGIRLFIPERSSETGEMTWKWVNVFKEAETSMKGDGYTYMDKEGMVQVAMRSNGVLTFKINPDVASYAFDMSRGYIQHPQNIVRLVNANHTPLFYTLLKHACAKGNKCRLTVEQIKEHLGLVERDEEDRVVKYMLPKYSQFKKLVIEKVQRDLERMAKENKIDITFTFEEYRCNGKKTGDPEYIEFTIKKSELGKVRDVAKHRESATKKLVSTLCKRCGDLKEDVILALITSVPEEDFADFVAYAYKDGWEITEKAHPEDFADYLLKVLGNWVDARIYVRHEKNAEQPDLFAEVEAREQEEARQRQEEEMDREYPGMFASEWETILGKCSPQYREWLTKATFKGGLRSNILIHFRTQGECNAFSEFERNNKQLKDEFERLYREVMHKPPYGPTLIRGFDKY